MGRRVHGLTVAALVWLVGGCADVAPSAKAAQGPVGEADATAHLLAWEQGWLDELGAADPRLALREARVPPREVVERVAAGAVVRGDRDVGIVDGAIDLFSFAERERQLAARGAELAQRRDVPDPTWRGEVALMTRLVEGEALRVARERQSPQSASERVRAIVETWGTPGSPRDVESRERLVERGLAPLLPDLAHGGLRGARALELEDALDALERLAVPEGYPTATQTITAIRVELGKGHAGAPPLRRDPSALPIQLATYLGRPTSHDTAGLDALRRDLDDEEQALRSDARTRLAGLPEHTRLETLASAATHVAREASCPHSAVSLVRAMKPPPERELVCDLVSFVARAEDPLADLASVVAAHDAVAIALWALALDGGAEDLDATRTAHPLLSAVAHDRQDRLVRAALVSPARAIAPGLAAVVLDADGPLARRGRAARWLAYGDAPFDFVSAALVEPGHRAPST